VNKKDLGRDCSVWSGQKTPPFQGGVGVVGVDRRIELELELTI
jgi:hypothetical protein